MLERICQQIFEFVSSLEHLVVEQEVKVMDCNLQEFFAVESPLLDQDLQGDVVLEVSDFLLRFS